MRRFVKRYLNQNKTTRLTVDLVFYFILYFQWMLMDEYVKQPFVQNHGQFKQIADICLQKMEGLYTGFSNQTTKSSKSGKTNIIYLNGRDVHYNHS